MTTTLRPPVLDGPDLGGPTPSRPPARKRWPLVLAGVVVVVAAAVVGLFFAPVFVARTVTVRGASWLDPATVRVAAAVDGHTPLLRLDTAAARRRVEALPAVASAQVSTSLPSTVVITVVQRVPVGYVKDADTVVLVDAAGVRFRTVPAPPAGLPRLDLGSGDARAAAAAVSAVGGALTPAERAAVTVIAADGSDVTLSLADRREVHWGGAARSAEKARLLEPLLGAGAPDWQHADLADPGIVVVR